MNSSGSGRSLRTSIQNPLPALVLSGLFLTPVCAGPDLNGNQLSDIWEVHFNATGLVAGIDDDGDGFTNAEEEKAGTNPLQSSSQPSLVFAWQGGSQISIDWNGEAGKSYELLFRQDFTSGTWQTATQVEGIGDPLSFGVPLASVDRGFFRLGISDADTDSDGLSDWEERLIGFNPENNQTQRIWNTDDSQQVASLWNVANTVTIGVIDDKAREDWPDPAVFVIRRSGGLQPITVNFSLSGSATRGTDYATLTGNQIQIPLGAREVWIEIAPIGDGLVEGDEDVVLSVSSGSGYSLGSTTSAMATISDASRLPGPEEAARFLIQAAFVANVGTLIEPVQNRGQVVANSKQLPLGLYSHSDQIEQWQTSIPHSRSGIGWAGRMADLLSDLNSEPVVPMNISLDGSNVWQTGNQVAEYSIVPGNNLELGGAVGLAGCQREATQFNEAINAASAAVDSQLGLTYTNLLARTFQNRKKQALDAYNLFHTATSSPLPGGAVFPNTPLGYRLRTVAQAIQGRAGIGAVRQTFFVQLGGWDHHSGVLDGQAAMLPQVSAAIGAFYNALTLMGVENQVTTFTASDFGRTLTSNGQGSDHAWGGNQIVVGGSVLGQRLHGQFPDLAVNPDSGPEVNPLDTGRGRFIPTTSCDAFFAEMALWLGVAPSDLPVILPNIGEFFDVNGTTAPVGFLA